MIYKFLAGAIACVSIASVPAAAATVLNPGDTVNLSFDGLVEGNVIPGLTATLSLKLDSISGQELNFS